MNDPQLVTTLRARSAAALADLFDAYGERLFRYCWGMLRGREVAQIALRDTLIVAAANIALLTDAELLGPWLYSLARAECRRRRPLPAAQADEPPARPSQADAEARLVAWNAAMSLAAAEFEALDLACRHRVDVDLVLGLPARDVRDLLGRARLSLRQALGAEILITKGSHDCPDRAEVLRGWTGTVTPELRERVLRHAADCPVCGPNLPRSVSAERVFALLPDPALPPGARAEVLGFFSDPRMSGYREFAVTRGPELAGSGFPATAGIAPQQADLLEVREVGVHGRRGREADRLADVPHRRRISVLLGISPDEVKDLLLTLGQIYPLAPCSGSPPNLANMCSEKIPRPEDGSQTPRLYWPPQAPVAELVDAQG